MMGGSGPLETPIDCLRLSYIINFRVFSLFGLFVQSLLYIVIVAASPSHTSDERCRVTLELLEGPDDEPAAAVAAGEEEGGEEEEGSPPAPPPR